jgi:tripartite-type tricarboxylate transporter receptor subunit TctC
MRHFLRGGFAAVLGWLLISAAADAQGVGDFYKGKTVTIVVGNSVGGAYDLYARLFAKYVPKYLPGAPNFVVTNMPGAATLTAANHVFNVAPQDGTFIASVNAVLPFQNLLDNSSARVDTVKANWLPIPTSETYVVIFWNTVPLTSFLDARNRETIMGSTGVGSSANLFSRVFNDVYGTRFKPVHGFGGTPDILLAMERGEVEGHPSASWSGVKSAQAAWVRNKKIKILMQYGGKPAPDLPDVPFGPDLATGDNKLFLEISMAPTVLARPYMMGPGVPKDRFAAMSTAFMKALQDPALVADAQKVNLEINPLSAEEVRTVIDRAYGAPQKMIDHLRELMSNADNK